MAKNKGLKEEYIEEESETKGYKPEQLIHKFLKDNEEEHLNFVEETNYKISTGSLILDSVTDGGLPPGLHRFVGQNESGKTSQSLQVMSNFFKTVPKARGLLIKAEGRLTELMKGRYDFKFVTKPEEWVDGTCFVYEGNIFESVNDLMKMLVFDNPHNQKYCFILDSMDALILRNDLKKAEDEEGRVAGGPKLTATLLKKMSLRLTKLGHLAIFISQVRSDINLDPYTKKVIRQTSATGGNAALHFANYILEFEPRFKGDWILTDPNSPLDSVKNPMKGHWVKITFKKSPNEKTNNSYKYPIKYGRTKVGSIWKEYEIIDQLFCFDHLVKKGAWINTNIDSKLMDDVQEKFKDFPKQIQGQDKLFTILENNQELTDYLFQRLSNAIIGSKEKT